MATERGFAGRLVSSSRRTSTKAARHLGEGEEFGPESAAADVLVAGIAAMGLRLEPEVPGLLLTYLVELSKWNRRFNLTAVHEPKDMVRRHLLDSLSLLPYLPQCQSQALGTRAGKASGDHSAGGPGLHGGRYGKAVPASVLDIGSGAGLPGLVVAACRRDLTVLLLDRALKKVRFTIHAANRLSLRNASAVHARVQSYKAPNPGHRLVVSRAFASPPLLLRHSADLVAPGGRLVAMCGVPEPEWLEACCGDGWSARAEPLAVPGLRDRNLLILSRAGQSEL